MYSLLNTQAKMQTEINNLRMAAFWPIGTAQIIRIVSYPIRKRFCLFCMWSVKQMYHALLLKTDYRDKGRGHDRRLNWAYYLPVCKLFIFSFSCLQTKYFSLSIFENKIFRDFSPFLQKRNGPYLKCFSLFSLFFISEKWRIG